jgi:hypothetical protein
MSNQDIMQLISNHLPQYSSLIQSDRIHQFILNPTSQPISAPMQTLQNSLPDSQSSSSSSEESAVTVDN